RTVRGVLAEGARDWLRDNLGLELPERDDDAEAEEEALREFAARVPDHAERCRILKPRFAEIKPSEGHIRLATLIRERYFSTVFSMSPDPMLEVALQNQRLLAGEAYILAVVGEDTAEDIRVACDESSRVAIVKLTGHIEAKTLPLTQEERARALSMVANVLAEQSRSLCIFVELDERDGALLRHISRSGRPVYWVSQRVPVGDRDSYDELKLESPESIAFHEFAPEVTELLAARGSRENLICREPGSFDGFFSELQQRLYRSRHRSWHSRYRDLSVAAGGPYRFLESFEVRHADIFFGREKETEDLCRLVWEHRLSVLFGKSGVGKSSLLKAGLMARLREPREGDDHESWLVVCARGLDDPVRHAKRALAAALEEDLARAVEPNPEASLREALDEAIRASGKNLLLVLDQFEENFVRLGKKALDDFVEQLRDSLEEGSESLHVILGVREEFLGELFELRDRLPGLFDHMYRLRRMDKDAAEDAIIKPPARFRLQMSTSVADRIIEALYRDGILPAELQIVCHRLYEALEGRRHTISEKRYEALGGAEQILGGFVTHMLAQLPRRERATARDILKQLTPAHERRTPLPLARISEELHLEMEDAERVIARLVDLRMIREIESDGQREYELVHEYLADALRGWLSQAELETKDVQELLARELNSYRKFRLLMHVDELRLVHEYREMLRMSRDELALVIRSAAHREFEFEYWLGRADELLEREHSLLGEILTTGSESVRRAVVRHLAQDQSPEAIPLLIECLRSEDEEVRKVADGALRTREREVVELLERGSTSDRAAAAWALGETEARRRLRELVRALRHPDARVRQAVSTALERLASPRATPLLLRALEEDGAPNWAAADVLGRIGEERELVAALAGRDDSAQAHYVLGRSYMSGRQLNRAAQEFDKALSLATDHEGLRVIEEARAEVASALNGKAIPSWDMFRKNVRRTGVSDEPAPLPLVEKWRYRTGDFVASSPAIVDGLVYCGARDGNLYCIEAASGALRWRSATRGRVESGPAVSGGVVYVGSHDGRVYAFDARTGSRRWARNLGEPVRSSCAVAGDRVFVGCWDKSVYALDASEGDIVWQADTDGEVYSSPAVAEVEGLVFVGSWDGALYCLDAKTGDIRWQFPTDGEVNSSPALARDLVVFGSDDGNVYAIDLRAGQLRWRTETDGPVRSSAAVTREWAYIGSSDGHLYALALATGEVAGGPAARPA
ncbi:MAG: PQQ-binding-like beta-propeller repeat protein, partial [Armatimonadota bacterium]